MPRMSASTVAIEAIVRSLSDASEAASTLEPQTTQDLRSLLALAITEAGRVRNAKKKPVAAASEPKIDRQPKAKAPMNGPMKLAKKEKGPRKATLPNGAAH